MFKLYIISMMFFWSPEQPMNLKTCQAQAFELNKVLGQKPKGVDALAICIPVRPASDD